MDLKNFKQNTTRAWMWFLLIGLSIFAALLALIMGLYAGVVSNLLIAWGIYWIDKLEKELTRRNFPPVVLPPDAPLPEQDKNE